MPTWERSSIIPKWLPPLLALYSQNMNSILLAIFFIMFHIRSLLRSETRYKQCVAAFQLAQSTVLLLLLDFICMQLPVMEALQSFCRLVQFCGSFQQLGNIIAVPLSFLLST